VAARDHTANGLWAIDVPVHDLATVAGAVRTEGTGQTNGGLHFVLARPGHLRGRDGLVAELDVLLADGAAAITPSLTGQGGIGKTQLAALYAHERGGRYAKGVFWVTLADAGAASMVSRFAECGRAVDLDPKEEGPPDRVDRALAAKWLAQYGGNPETLLVVDNLEDPRLLTSELPGLSPFKLLDLGCRELITSRRGDLPGCRALRLDRLPPPADREVLLDATAGEVGGPRRQPQGAQEEAALDHILAMLGGLPLALRLTGGLVASRPRLLYKRLADVLAAQGARVLRRPAWHRPSRSHGSRHQGRAIAAIGPSRRRHRQDRQQVPVSNTEKRGPLVQRGLVDRNNAPARTAGTVH
jgi:hypothetical protein